jgi:hypothetical protein
MVNIKKPINLREKSWQKLLIVHWCVCNVAMTAKIIVLQNVKVALKKVILTAMQYAVVVVMSAKLPVLTHVVLKSYAHLSAVACPFFAHTFEVKPQGVFSFEGLSPSFIQLARHQPGVA